MFAAKISSICIHLIVVLSVCEYIAEQIPQMIKDKGSVSLLVALNSQILFPSESETGLWVCLCTCVCLGGRGFLNPSHICVITCMRSESKQAATKDYYLTNIFWETVEPTCFFLSRKVMLLFLPFLQPNPGTSTTLTHPSCWESCCFPSPTAWWTGCCKWTLRGEPNVKVTCECTRPCLHYSQITISSIVWYIKAVELGLHLGVFPEKRPAGDIIRWDFPQLGMTGPGADSRVWLIISWAGSLNTD